MDISKIFLRINLTNPHFFSAMFRMCYFSPFLRFNDENIDPFSTGKIEKLDL